LRNIAYYYRGKMENLALFRREVERSTSVDQKMSKGMVSFLVGISERSSTFFNVTNIFQLQMNYEVRTAMSGGESGERIHSCRSVSGIIGLLADTDLKPEQQGYVDTLEKSVESLMNLVTDSMNYFRVRIV
jgi:hypothetical protein